MKLKDLDASFVQPTKKGFRPVKTLKAAKGVFFQCPKCAQGKRKAKDGGYEGAHYVLCWFRGKVPDDLDPAPGRWTPEGNGLDDLTFVPGEPPQAVSVLLIGGCGWHGFIRNGEVTLS